MESNIQESEHSLNGEIQPNEEATVIKTPIDNKSIRLTQILAVLVACLGAVSCGFVRGYAAPAIPDLQRPLAEGGMALDLDQVSWFASLVAAGALLGGIIGAFMVDRLGRKTSLIISCAPFVVGWFLIIYSFHLAILLCGRVLTGFAMGISTVCIPLYISECTPKYIRGRMTAFYQISVTFGGFCTLTTGLFISYRWIAVIASVFSTLLVILMPFMPETPRWFMKKGDKNSALESLNWLYRGKVSNMDETELQDLLDIEVEQVHFKDFFKDPGLYKPLIISSGLMFFQQFNGANSILFYFEDIIDIAGFKNMETYPTIVFAILPFLTISILSSSLVDKVGRKPLLITSGIFVSFGFVLIGMYFILVSRFHINKTLWYVKFLPLGGLFIYRIAFALGWGPISWVVMAEIFPIKARGISSGIVTCTHWICLLITTKVFPYLLANITPYGTFWLISGINVCSVIFVIFMLPETKGVSLEAIERLFKSTSNGKKNGLRTVDS